MSTVRYMGYEGTVEFDSERKVLRGKILFIHDLVTYESHSVPGIQKEFEAAVDDYIETCKELGREPQKPCTGQFNVRTPPQVHRQAVERAARDSSTLNDVVNRALISYLSETSGGAVFNVVLQGGKPFVAAATTSMSDQQVWEQVSVH